MSIPALSVENVVVGYGGPAVIHDINLTVEPGEILGLIGLNGAGKTTLIKAILGLRHQEAGGIQVFGTDAQQKTARKKFAYLPERFEPPWFLSGEEFIEFSLSLYGEALSQDDIYTHAQSLALDPQALKKRVQTYSKGMRQKLGLLATVLTRCPLLILDEPMSGLDPKARSLVKAMLRSCKEQGQSVFFSSHILADMDEMCDRVTLMHDGVLKFTGKPAQLRSKSKGESLENAFLRFIEAA
ncbi:MAG: ABC transporter ATP-binding protein [Alphaproteobacteria bacterium]|nr:ABC transporter ATP-binding protein [Alphaproteobacteria bacterium]